MGRVKRIGDGEVLEKALLVISERGPERFSLADVGKAVGLSPATLLQRFGSKDKLLVEAARQANRTLQGKVADLKAQGLPWREELAALLYEMPEGFGSREEIANSLGLLRLDMIDPQLHPLARSLFQTLRERVVELIGPFVAEAEDMAWELDALRHGLVIQWTLSGEGKLQEWLKKGITDYLERRLS